MTPTCKKLYIDPPMGSKYGFPRVWDWDPAVESEEQWFRRKGYPQSLIDQGMLKYCRTWTKEELDEEFDPTGAEGPDTN